MQVAKTFEQAERFFIQGKYQEAADTCREIITADANFAGSYYLLGELFKATGSFDQAVAFSDMAIERNPKDAKFYVQKGHALVLMGKPNEAEEALKQAISVDSNTPLAYILLANIAMKSRDFASAKSILLKAKDIASLPEIEEHLGLCEQLLGNIQAAEAHFRFMITLAPKLARGHLHLAKILLSQKRKDEAESVFRTVLSLDDKATDAMVALAHIQEQKGNLSEGMQFAYRAAQLNPKLSAAFVMLGGMLIASGQHAQAEPVYVEGLKHHPDNLMLLEGYAKVLMQLVKLEEAKIYIAKVLEKKPDDKNMQYYMAAISGQGAEIAPRAYVAGLFDEYSERFEEHLTKGLGYHTPREVAAAVHAALGLRDDNKTNLSLLDLGCGTGLGAEALKDITAFRVGVDLSSKMIEKSKQKNLYDETAVADIVEYMEQTPHRFDLVICVDTLVYIGNLDPFFKAASMVLNSGGLLVVSAEQGDDAETYILRPSARYGHAKAYLISFAEIYGLTLKSIALHDLRKDKDGVIQGYVAVYEKKGAL